MSRLLWGAVALLAVTVAVALATAGPDGPVPEQALAHIITPTGTPGAPMVHLEIDADTTNGSGPCNPVDATAEVYGMHKVAVCLTSSLAAPAGFDFDLVYDPALNTCTNESCPTGTCFDDNPDANLGTTTFSTPDLGTGWDCSASEPVCAKSGQAGRAFIMCLCVDLGCATLPVGADVSAPIAVVTFNEEAGGVDNLKLEDVALFDENIDSIVQCHGSGPCYGATLFVQAPIGGIAEAPLTEADVLADERASSVPNSLALAALAALGALLVAAGAWYARRRRRAG